MSPFTGSIPPKVSSMNRTFLIAKKEYKDAFRSGLIAVIFLIMILLSGISITISSVLFHDQVLEYNQSVDALKKIGKTPPGPPVTFYPLTLLRGMIDYLEIIGAILGIFLGYLSITKEKKQRTMQLILTRPVKRNEIMLGKVLGNLSIVSTIILILIGLVWSALWSIGGTMLSMVESEKLLLTMFMSILYIMLFYLLSSFTTLTMKKQSHSLMVCFVIWLVLVLIMPQIGDTMDPDNQVPGGFFKSMDLNKTKELEVLSHFNSYERTRNGIEEISVTKHYERASFALLGIKDQFNGKPIDKIVTENWYHFAMVFVLLIAGLGANLYAINKRNIFTGGM